MDQTWENGGKKTTNFGPDFDANLILQHFFEFYLY